MQCSSQEITPGVWKVSLGTPECFTPHQILQPSPAVERLAALPSVHRCPLEVQQIVYRKTNRGFEVHLPLAMDEQVYGLGLQLMSFKQTGLKKTLRVNSDPRCDLGDSHAPVPFYVTTKGYGILVDTARYATFYCGATTDVANTKVDARKSPAVALDTETLYASRDLDSPRRMIVEIPGASGVELYVFSGPTMVEAVQRYNLFSGGGCVPPRWALGHWYRVRSDFNQDQINNLASELRASHIPCDVIGIEPGWQTHAYSCSHIWSEKFPDPSRFIAGLRNDHFQVNLWTHAFTHSSSPIYEALLPHSGDYAVFGGLVPDFLDPNGRDVFINHYRETIVTPGVSGLKLDECDNSDFIHSPWSFPEISQFPSGLDGEQMHSLFGSLLQTATSQLYTSEKRRTFGLIRNSHAYAASHPYVLYSDLYDHRQFVRGIVNASFSGLLWCPEIRESSSGEELVRRLQSAVVSPLLQVNGWYIANPPWKQWQVEANNNNDFVPDWQEWQRRCRSVLELRMRLIPYIHSAFFQYWQDGTPPFRAMVLDYPNEKKAWEIDDQILIGDRLLAAPVIDDSPTRRLWLPPGVWVNFWTGEPYEGGAYLELKVNKDQLPLFVKNDCVLPLAAPTLHTEDPKSFNLDVVVYGSGATPAVLIEEASPEFPFDRNCTNLLSLSWDPSRELLTSKRENAALAPLYSVYSVRTSALPQSEIAEAE